MAWPNEADWPVTMWVIAYPRPSYRIERKFLAGVFYNSMHVAPPSDECLLELAREVSDCV